VSLIELFRINFSVSKRGDERDVSISLLPTTISIGLTCAGCRRTDVEKTSMNSESH